MEEQEKPKEKATLKIAIPDGLMARLKETIGVLKSRGVEIKPEELVREYFASIHEDYFNEQVVKLTPDDYYLKAGAQIPNLRERWVKQAMRRLLTHERPQGVSQKPRRKKADLARKEAHASVTEPRGAPDESHGT